MTTYKNLLTILVLVAVPVSFYGQTANKNYVLTQKVRQEGLTPDDFNNANFSPREVIEQVGYFDGLGRPIQKIQIGISPKERDVIIPIEYDASGRISKRLLQFTKANNGEFDNTVVSNQEMFYQSEPQIANTYHAYSEIKYDNSPLNIAIETSAPGYTHQMNEGHTNRVAYKLNNGGNNMLFFEYNNISGSCTNSINYPAGTLKLTEHTDENNIISIGYSDASGKVITTAEQTNPNTDFAHTYYVYDDFGQLRYVIPPEGLKQLYETSGNYNFLRTDDVVNNYFFWYKYDKKHRLTEKKEPGKDVVYIIYDELDRPVLTQDGLQRPTNKWSFIKYDKHSRPIQTGIYIASGTISGIQTDVNLYYVNDAAPNYEEIIVSMGQVAYTNSSFPNTTAQTTVYKEIYYDNYSFDDAGLFPFIQEAYISENTEKVKGFMTGSKSRIINSSPVEWLHTVYYYDEYGRNIQSLSQNHLEGWDRYSKLIEFDGQVMSTIHTHMIFEGDQIKEETTTQTRSYEYDHAGRLLTIHHSINDAEPVQIVANVYNELGQLIEKNMHSNPDEGYLQSVDYKYNIRGRLKRINSPNLGNNNNLIDLEEVLLADEKVAGMQLDTITFKVADYKDGLFSTLTLEIEDSKSLKIAKIADPDDIRYFDIGDRQSVEIFDNTMDVELFQKLHTKLGQQYVFNMGELEFNENFDRQSMLDGITNKIIEQLGISGEKDIKLIEAIYMQISNYFKGRIEIVYFNEDNDDLFGMELYYSEGFSELDGDIMYDGKITGMRWQTTVNPGIKAYGYQYDEQHRLKQAKYGEYYNYSWDKENKFGLNINTYDLNGNIKELERYGLVGSENGQDIYGLMDDLNYNYNGNQLDELNDNITGLTFESNDFRDNGSNQAGEYDYDANGNLIKDDNKGITNISYNHINLPVIIEFGTTKKIEYLYTAEGAKLQMKIIDGTNVVTMDYAAGFVYVNEEVDYVLTEEGRLTPSTGENPFVYEYFLKDHLGNVRVSFSDYNGDGVGEILQENHYYPFGLTFGGLDYISPISSENLLQYNGKENQEGHNLAWVDYGFRMYDPQIGRWHVSDALASMYKSTSPYAYVRNDPISRIDFMGLNDIEGGTSGGLGGFLPTGLSANGINTPYGPDNNSANNMWNDITSSVGYGGDKDYREWYNARTMGGTNISFSKWQALKPQINSSQTPSEDSEGLFFTKTSDGWGIAGYYSSEGDNYIGMFNNITIVPVGTGSSVTQDLSIWDGSAGGGESDWAGITTSVASAVSYATGVISNTFSSTRTGSNIAHSLSNSKTFLTSVKYLKPIGYWASGFGIGTDVIMSFDGSQTWTETGINTAVTGIAIGVGGWPGLIIQGNYQASKAYMNTISKHPEWILPAGYHNFYH